MNQRFKVIFLEDAKEFLNELEEKVRTKIYYNIWKAKQKNDNELFKKLQDEIRKGRNLTQQELGEIIGVKKVQISKIENSLTDARFDTILKVFRALNAKINFNIEFLNQKLVMH